MCRPRKSNESFRSSYPLLDDGETFVEDEAALAQEDSEFARLGRQFEYQPFFLRRVNAESSPQFSRDRLRGCRSAAQVRHRPAARHPAPRWLPRC